MSFVQLDYLPFLLACVTAFVWAPRRLRGVLLLAASLGFYAYQSPVHTLLLLTSAALDFAVGLGLERVDPERTDSEHARKRLLSCSLIGNLALLGVFKYASLFEDLVSRVTGAAPGQGALAEVATWTLPLGISFYTFQTISYSFDVYRRKIPACRNPLHYLLYVSFFPQLVAGPIERAGRLLPQLVELRAPTAEDFSRGARLIAWGTFKKTVLADRLRLYVWPAFERPEAYGASSLFLAATCMLVVLYLDFSAYTEIARGSARLFGIHLVRNFDRPFLATSISQMWSRWHMSLTGWIADYVYSPMSRGPLTHFVIWRNNLIAMGAFGLWHGASWKFLFWGLLNGVLVAAYQSGRLRGRFRRRTGEPGRARLVLDWAFTMLTAVLAIVFFFAPTLEHGLRMVGGMIPAGLPGPGSLRGEVLACWGLLAVGLLVHSTPAWLDLERWWSRITVVGRLAWIAGLAFLSLRYGLESPASFVYFEF